MVSNYTIRPWGNLKWILDKLPKRKWDMIGCISTEDRCLAAIEQENQIVDKKMFLLITDPVSHFTVEANQMIQFNTSKYLTLTKAPESIKNFNLFERYNDYVVYLLEFLKTAGADIILDITTMPKRYFFPILKILIKNESIKNLIVTYSIPQNYYEGNLTENPEEVTTLPLFEGLAIDIEKVDKPELSFIGVGFMTMGLKDLIKKYVNTSFHFLLPFPPGPPLFQKNLMFMNEILSNISSDTFKKQRQQILRVDAKDASGTFDYICSFTNNGLKKAIFAPFGPKPISLGMCIYATISESQVYYSQPKNYNPYYSSGIKKVNGISEIYSYCIKLNGRSLYNVNNNA